jgi:hypothetical protein
MNKLTNFRLAFGQRNLRLSRKAFSDVAVRPAAPAVRARNGLLCSWTRDPATGRLRCRWSNTSQQDRSIVHRPGRPVVPVSQPPLKLAA